MAVKQKVITIKLINYLFDNPNKTITTKELVSAVYGDSVNMRSRKRYIDVCICKEIRPELKKPEFTEKKIQLKSIRRVGLRLEVPS